MTNHSEEPDKNMDDKLLEMLKYLRLRNLLSQWDEILDKARQGRYSAERLLTYVLEEEYRAKRENARLLRRPRANIPELLEMETYPFSRQPKLDRKKIMSYYDRFDYMTKHRNMVWLGPTGCGKSGLRGSRAGAGGTVFYAHAQAAQEENDHHHLQPRLRGMGIVSAQPAPDRRLDRSAHGEQPRHQHEGLP